MGKGKCSIIWGLNFRFLVGPNPWAVTFTVPPFPTAPIRQDMTEAVSG